MIPTQHFKDDEGSGVLCLVAKCPLDSKFSSFVKVSAGLIMFLLNKIGNQYLDETISQNIHLINDIIT